MEMEVAEKLKKMDDECLTYQNNGQFLEAMAVMEASLVLRRRTFGADSDEVIDCCKSLGEMCNLMAMSYLQSNDFSNAHVLLRKAEILSKYDLVQRANTYNNFGCFFRQRGQLLQAVGYLEKATKIESELQLDGNPVEKAADTHLNVCACLSQLGRHGEALEHAQEALIQLQEELLPITPDTADEKADRISVLCIAYYNCGVEQEFLKKLLQAHKTYVRGYDLAEKYLGAQHSIAATFRGSLNTLGDKLDLQIEKEEKEEMRKRISKMTPAQYGRINS
eukprot:g2773.t1